MPAHRFCFMDTNVFILRCFNVASFVVSLNNIHVFVSMKLTHACEIMKGYKIHICWIEQAFLQTFDM
jgi:hypothetical protein